MEVTECFSVLTKYWNIILKLVTFKVWVNKLMHDDQPTELTYSESQTAILMKMVECWYEFEYNHGRLFKW